MAARKTDGVTMRAQDNARALPAGAKSKDRVAGLMARIRVQTERAAATPPAAVSRETNVTFSGDRGGRRYGADGRLILALAAAGHSAAEIAAATGRRAGAIRTQLYRLRQRAGDAEAVEAARRARSRRRRGGQGA